MPPTVPPRVAPARHVSSRAAPAGPSFAAALALCALGGCVPENDVKEIVPDPNGVGYAPQIVVTPGELLFSELDLGDSEDLTFNVSNAGDADLHIASLSLYGSSAFTLMTTASAITLAPAQSVDFIVSYSPAAPEERAELHIASDDVGNPDALVEMEGAGRFPELLISPNPLDFGAVLVGCSRTVPITLRNIGHGALHVSSIAQLGDSFTAALPSLPLTLAPDESVPFDLTLFAASEAYVDSQIVVSSDDAVSVQTADQGGHGTLDGAVEDEFWQGDGPWDKTDIFFYVDQSCSMIDDQRNLSANFSSFADRLGELNLDWQVMVSTRDDGCHNGDILTPESPDAITAFLEGVTGRGGEYTEAGLTIAEHALAETGSGGCNAGFLREGAKTMVVLVSDEVEQSGSNNSQIWRSLTDSMVQIAPSVSITSIAGDIPDGCARADPGYGYYEASQWTNGAFLSICSPDWAGYFETIADLSATGQISTFYLSSWSDGEGIVVAVDNRISPDNEWDYDASLNAVVFASGFMPGPGSHITVNYSITSDCEG